MTRPCRHLFTVLLELDLSLDLLSPTNPQVRIRTSDAQRLIIRCVLTIHSFMLAHSKERQREVDGYGTRVLALEFGNIIGFLLL
jgi:hypothetical protein